MKTFELTNDMTNIRGQFYPTGHVVAMFPSESAARAAAQALAEIGLGDNEVSWISPEAMMRDVVRTIGNSGMELPSAGTEADTVRRYSHLAAQGHHSLLIHSPHHGDDDKLMETLRKHGVSHAQKYRMLVIEDLA
jgi:hypothetical protein